MLKPAVKRDLITPRHRGGEPILPIPLNLNVKVEVERQYHDRESRTYIHEASRMENLDLETPLADPVQSSRCL